MNDISAKNIALAINYSESYIRHIFSEKSGENLSSFILKVRLSQAANMLLSTNQSVTSIAFECGLNDSNYFSTVFKKHFGLSPREYRNTQNTNTLN